MRPLAVARPLRSVSLVFASAPSWRGCGLDARERYFHGLAVRVDVVAAVGFVHDVLVGSLRTSLCSVSARYRGLLRLIVAVDLMRESGTSTVALGE